MGAPISFYSHTSGSFASSANAKESKYPHLHIIHEMRLTVTVLVMPSPSTYLPYGRIKRLGALAKTNMEPLLCI